MSKLMKSEWRDRISHWVRTLKDDFYQPLGEIQWEAFRTNEQLSLGEAKKEQFVSVKPGFTWGNTYEYCWMKGHIQLSEEAEGKRIVMNLKPDGEATLFVNDKAFGTYRASWVNEPHHYIVDNVLSRCAKGDEQFDIMMEVYAGHYYPEAPTGGPITALTSCTMPPPPPTAQPLAARRAARSRSVRVSIPLSCGTAPPAPSRTTPCS